MSLMTEAELGAACINACEAVHEQTILAKLSHHQLQTSIITDNTTAKAIINHKIQPKQIKAMDMYFHWLHDREEQEQSNL